MERSSLGRWLLIAASVFLLMTFLPKLFGGGSSGRQPLKPEGDRVPAAQGRKPEKLCDLWGPGFRARISTHGASIKHFFLLGAKYRKDGHPLDLSTTPDQELRRQLRFDFRNPAAGISDDKAQVQLDLVDFEITRADGHQCELVYRDDRVELRQVLSVTSRRYEILADATVKNLADHPLVHALDIHTDAWRTDKEVHGAMFRVSPLMTHVECVPEDGSATRLSTQDFEPDDFQKTEHFPKSDLTAGDWYEAQGKPALAAVSNAYFSHAVVPLSKPSPRCQLQVEERWDSHQFKKKSEDPNAGAMYRARLAYAPLVLKPGAEASYEVLTYVGPKERSVLAHAAGGDHRLIELIDLGFFSAIAKILVAFLLKVYSVVPNWGLAIIVLTITARSLLFPLALPGIKGMIKMRELKPEIEALNQKFKDDAQAKGVAQMELWRKHNVNPLKGCLPQLASMPVWFALYTTLQTAVELYNIPFLWFPDLSQADPFYVLPFIIGGTSFLQQKLMPMQTDAAQQKMMLYFMPGMFTVFMLFLPSGLGVYMFTNGVLGILQQQAVEWHVRRSIRRGGGPGSGAIKVEVIEDAARDAGAAKASSSRKGRGKRRAGEQRFLGEGKA
jgi:YidC/Oxa1 family membrane protein insertase